jgi:hypothetical protein
LAVNLKLKQKQIVSLKVRKGDNGQIKIYSALNKEFSPEEISASKKLVVDA